MPVRACLFVAMAATICARAAAGEKLWTVRGRVIDGQGHGIPAAELSPYWAASGVKWADVEALVKARNGNALWAETGRMEAWGSRRPVSTNADGSFALELEDVNHWFLAMDKERKRGAVVAVDPKAPPTDLKVTLQPLVKVRGIVRVAGKNAPVQSSCVSVRNLPSPKFPLARGRLAACCSDKSQFEFLLPPGEYLLEANNDETLDKFLAETTGLYKITVPSDKLELDAGTLELSISTRRHASELIEEAKRKGTFGDYRKHYGRKPPQWHIADARGVGKDVQIADFKGKWVVLYFWGPDCVPCLKNGIPKLMKFDEAHAKTRDRFVILSFCLNYRGEFKTIAEVDKHLEHVVQNVWGKPPAFPMLLDNTFATYESFGLDSTCRPAGSSRAPGLGDLLLIDPEGRLVEGDLETLAGRLKAP